MLAECPVCGTRVEPSLPGCPSCQLASELFNAVREAAGPEGERTEYARAIAEILTAVGPEHVGPGPSSESSSEFQGVLYRPARFPAPAPIRVQDPAVAAPLERLGSVPLPELPALGPGTGAVLVQRQVEDLLQVGRRQGLDIRGLDSRLAEAAGASDRDALESLRRAVFVQVAAGLAEEFEVQTARRNELAALTPTATVDAELASSRTALGSGDLAGAQRRLRQTSDRLSKLEEQWATTQILVAEAELILGTLVELGVDSTGTREPLEEGRRLARTGESDAAERTLAKANRALWERLAPPLTKSLALIRDQVRRGSQEGLPIEPVVRELRQMAALIRRRNFGAAISSYQRLREAVSTLATESEPSRTSDLSATDK